jgi:wobble nucleotide-excising tRNase
VLKSIEKIKGFGVYGNYQKPAGTKEFSKKNIIYGWNYSGKTTLSRLFAQLEAPQTINPDFKGCEFTFNSGPDAITEKNIATCPHQVRVFNSDFIKKNLFFDTGNANAILLLGKESEAAQNEIDRLNKRLVRSQDFRRKAAKDMKAIDDQIADQNKDDAKNIRQRLKMDVYNASHLTKDVGLLFEDYHLSEEDLEAAIELANTPNSKKPLEVSEVLVTPQIEALHKKALPILEATPTFSNTIKHLEEHPAIERWVETGLPLHRDKDVCEFCGGELNAVHMATLVSHFSKDLAEHKQRVETLLQLVKAAAIEVDLPKPAELNTQFQEAYKTAAARLTDPLKAYNDAVERLATEVQTKVENSRKALIPTVLPIKVELNLTEAVAAINAVIQKNNKLANAFQAERDDARHRARMHLVQESSDKAGKLGLSTKRAKIKGWDDRVTTFSEKTEARIKALQAEISQAQQGREKINERLAMMLGSQAVQIEVTTDTTGQDRFQLVRKGGFPAKNLSEGERTAIAFSYFLTKLKEIKDADFKQTIVYIDDPISSLDSNHIFQVNAAITELFSELKVTGKNSEWDISCKQLFISTHNFEFFNLMKELKPMNDANARLFLVKQIAEGKSVLCDMPTSLSKYGTEYHFLFDRLYRYHSDPNKTADEHMLMLPNVLRRFLELYCFSRIPTIDKANVDGRAAELFEAERAKTVLKFLHTFSHGNSFERLIGNSENIFLLEQTVKDVFDDLEQRDNRHWKALLEAVQ